jgi:signal transduction histidine kinase
VKKRSIGFRLAAWYFLVLSCSLGVFSIVAWFSVRASIYHAIDDELRDRVRGVAKFMNLQIASLSVPEIRDEFREHSVLGPGGDLFQVCDQDGQWLYRSVPLESNGVAIIRPGDLDTARFETLRVEGRSLRFYSRRIDVNGKPYTVQVAAPIHEAFEALDRFRMLLLFTAPLLLIAASAGGYWLSTRALAPVDEISRAAQRISIENLADRLPVPPTGDQLQRLSETLNAMFARLETAVRRITQFTADASHELRAPVALIRTTAEVAVHRSRAQCYCWPVGRGFIAGTNRFQHRAGFDAYAVICLDGRIRYRKYQDRHRGYVPGGRVSLRDVPRARKRDPLECDHRAKRGHLQYCHRFRQPGRQVAARRDRVCDHPDWPC